MLLILGGLPGTGKTTIARALARDIGATHFRIDTIETTVKNMNLSGENLDKAGYFIAANLAKDALNLNQIVISDCVNGVTEARELWRDVATSTNKPFIEIEIICSDKNMHKKRAEERLSDIEGLNVPSWEEIQKRDFEPWNSCSLQLDTATLKIEACVNKIKAYLKDHT